MFVGVQNLEVSTYWSIPSLREDFFFYNSYYSKQATPAPKTLEIRNA
jgi:hypothetical protein